MHAVVRSFRRPVGAAGLVILCLAAVASAQTPDAQMPVPAQQPPIRSGASLIRVDAYPTRGGVPVQGLTADDFEVREDGVVQAVATFEHVVVQPAGPTSERRDPGNQRAMRLALENPKARVFVVFLDTPHVRVEGSHFIIEPVIRLINRLLGPDDLYGLMLPGMSPDQITFARKTDVTEQQLRDNWTWGQRFSLIEDEKGQEYQDCYGLAGPGGLAARLSARRKERATLDALQDLVRFLQATREGRTAVLAVSEGWALYESDESLLAAGDDGTGHLMGVPKPPPVTVGPDGKLTTHDPREPDRTTCEADRLELARLDDRRLLLQIVEEANRANTSFYPIDPRGLAVFDFPISAAVPLDADKVSLVDRRNSLRDLAGGTDGIAVMDSNDLDKGLRRISDDLTSYYLIGYYSSNARLDGAFHAIKVRVKQPGVDVRARRGYRAPTAAEAAAARKAEAAPAPDVTAPLESALGDLSRVLPASRLRLQATRAPGTNRVWVSGELPAAQSGDAWASGGTASLMVMAGDTDESAGSGRATFAAGQRSFVVPIDVSAAPDVPLTIQARIAPAASGAPVSETFRIPPSATARPVLYRRGPSTVNREVPTADPRFLRSDRVHMELAVPAGTEPGAGRLLDRTGKPLNVPVTIGTRTDAATGQVWITADVILAPLAPADYLVEIGTRVSGADRRTLAAIQLTR